MLEEFLDGQPAEAAAEVQAFFAGGIHDERSAAMVAALAAPLTRRGVQVGRADGHAPTCSPPRRSQYGAIQPLFQRRAIEATQTALLETAPGPRHPLPASPRSSTSSTTGVESSRPPAWRTAQSWEQLEMLNVGRLRIASKGLRREGDELVAVDAETPGRGRHVHGRPGRGAAGRRHHRGRPARPGDHGAARFGRRPGRGRASALDLDEPATVRGAAAARHRDHRHGLRVPRLARSGRLLAHHPQRRRRGDRGARRPLGRLDATTQPRSGPGRPAGSASPSGAASSNRCRSTLSGTAFRRPPWPASTPRSCSPWRSPTALWSTPATRTAEPATPASTTAVPVSSSAPRRAAT